MLVLKRRNGEWTDISITQETMKRLLESGQDANLRFRTYNIMGNGKEDKLGRVDCAFDDPECNFIIDRPERKVKQRTLNGRVEGIL